jgi:hypothetical protein
LHTAFAVSPRGMFFRPDHSYADDERTKNSKGRSRGASQGVSRVQLTQDPPQCAEDKKGVNTDPQPLTARMLNEFVYCPRLFYYEHVEGVFVRNADTVRGTAAHQRADSDCGSLPPSTEEATKQASEEAIHSRSVMLGSAK